MVGIFEGLEEIVNIMDLRKLEQNGRYREVDRLLRLSEKKIYGWVLPSGEFVEVPFYRHLGFIKERPDVVSDSRIVEAEKEVDDIAAYCEALQEEEGHGDWHEYEMADGRLNDLIIRVAYDLGYIRVGSSGYTLMFEGERNNLVGKYDRLRNLTESLGFNKSDFRPVDQVKREPTRMEKIMGDFEKINRPLGRGFY